MVCPANFFYTKESIFYPKTFFSIGNLTSNLEVEVAPDDWRQVEITHVAGVTVSAELDGAAAGALTGVRYAYYDNPACPTAYDHFHLARNQPCKLTYPPSARSSASRSNKY